MLNVEFNVECWVLNVEFPKGLYGVCLIQHSTFNTQHLFVPTKIIKSHNFTLGKGEKADVRISPPFSLLLHSG